MSDSPNSLEKELAASAGTGRARRLPPGTICREPFRLLFPIGILIGISGVSLWPLFFSGLHKFYPGIMHARMMIQGFMGAFVFGFLGTALPRLTGTSALSRWELGSLVVLLLGAMGLHIGHKHTFGDMVFLALLISFLGSMGTRFTNRADLPPPTFALVAIGFVNALLGTALLVSGSWGMQDVRWAALGSLLLYQGFILSLVLGVGGFLLPRFLGVARKDPPDESPEYIREWKQRAILASSVGAVIFATFALEVFGGAPKLAGTIRLVTVALFLSREIPLRSGAEAGPTVARSLRLAFIFVLAGILFPILWPIQRVAGLHLLFIGGFTLITLTVATRVVLGHSGKGHAALRPFAPLGIAASLLVLAAILRAVGDFLLLTRGRWLDAASYTWMIAAMVWGWCVLPNVRVPDPEETP